MEELLKLLGLNESPLMVIIGAICLAVIAVASFSESIQKLMKLKKEISPHLSKKMEAGKLSRRRFIYGSAATGISIVGGYFLFNLLKIRETFTFISKPNKKGYLIANKKTRAIHHSKLCERHLPDKANQILDFSKIKSPYPHKFRNINIYEVMANKFQTEKNFDEAIIYLKKAIEQSPERVHIYDALAKLYGRQRKYRQINELYKNGEKKITAKLAISQNKRQLRKAKNDISSRLERIKLKYNMV
jgi:tetratricopeptide (TPR) repeat protein